MESINIAFSDFWEGFNYRENFITKILSSKYQINIVNLEDNPDILFYSFFGTKNLKVNLNTIKVYFTGENDVPDFNMCDYGISFNYINFGERHFRLPLYVLYPSFERLRNSEVIKSHQLNRDFCSVVISNSKKCDPTRIRFFEQLNKYKTIASGGLFANNIGGRVKNKLSFLSNYKFNIAFENSNIVGYTSEKLIDALASGTLPIYWGNPLVHLEIDERTFININNFKSFNDAIEYIKEIDNNSELYNQYFTVNPFTNNKYLEWEKSFFSFLSNIVESRTKYITSYGGMGIIKETRTIQSGLYRFYNVFKLFPNVFKLKYILSLGHQYNK